MKATSEQTLPYRHIAVIDPDELYWLDELISDHRVSHQLIAMERGFTAMLASQSDSIDFSYLQQITMRKPR